MAKSKSDLPPIRTYRDAFCRKYRCRPTDFERKVFWKALCRRAYFPVLLTGGLDPGFFQKDLETIRAIGECSTLDEFERVLDDFSSMQHVERSLRRRFLRFRISGTRLAALFRGMEFRIETPAVDEVVASVPATEAARTAPTPVVAFPAVAGGDANVGMVRKLKRAHELITTGKLLNEVLSEIRLTEEEFEAALSNHGSSRLELAWLKSHILERRELEALRSERDRLREVIADLSVHGELRVLGDR